MAKAYKNETHELDTLNSRHAFSNIHPLKHEQNYQLWGNFVIFHFYDFSTKTNYTLIQICKTQSLYVIQDFRHAQKALKHAYRNYFLNSSQYNILIKILIKMFCLMNIYLKNIASQKAKAEIIKICILDIYPSISSDALEVILIILLYFDTLDEFTTSNDKLAKLTGVGIRKIQYITGELKDLEIIDKHTRTGFNGKKKNNCTLTIKINLPKEFFHFISDKKRQFLATYVKTEELHTKGFLFKVAVFKDVHDLDNIITLKTDRISYNDKTSNFLKKLNSGDVISYTPSINKPTIKGIKHPLNLKMYTKAESEEDMTFFATFDGIEVKNVKWYGLKREDRFKDMRNIRPRNEFYDNNFAEKAND
jgi:hypothetical protein